MLIDGMVSFNGGADSRAISRVLQEHQVGLYSSRLWGIKQLVPQRASSKQLPSHQIFGCLRVPGTCVLESLQTSGVTQLKWQGGPFALQHVRRQA